jgi:topoisomerase-4 subunit A
MGEASDYYLLCSDAGYGFVTKLEELYCKNRSGKTVIKPVVGSEALAMAAITDLHKQYLVAISTLGKMLIFPVASLPELARGKGNKIMSLPSAAVKDRSEYMLACVVMSAEDTLLLRSGKRELKLRFSDLVNYQNERGRRGSSLPRGYQKIDGVNVIRA